MNGGIVIHKVPMLIVISSIKMTCFQLRSAVQCTLPLAYWSRFFLFTSRISIFLHTTLRLYPKLCNCRWMVLLDTLTGVDSLNIAVISSEDVRLSFLAILERTFFSRAVTDFGLPVPWNYIINITHIHMILFVHLNDSCRISSLTQCHWATSIMYPRILISSSKIVMNRLNDGSLLIIESETINIIEIEYGYVPYHTRIWTGPYELLIRCSTSWPIQVFRPYGFFFYNTNIISYIFIEFYKLHLS